MFDIFGAVKVVAIVGALGGLAYGIHHISTLERDLAVSENNAEILEEIVAQQKLTIAEQKQNYLEILESNKVITTLLQANRDRIDDLNNKFNESSNGDPRDLNNLAVTKPALVERIINRASKNAIRCIEIATGAPLTQKELSVTKRSESNNECPYIHPLLGDSVTSSSL